MAKVDKVVVTNTAALHAKYGTGFNVGKALKPIVDADARRGLSTRVIDLSNATEMRRVGGEAVPKPGDHRATKEAIDAIFKALRPHYLLIVGSRDVVSAQRLRNPTPDDGDADVPTDLPYACEHGFSDRAHDFRAPTRVVGRLPDGMGATEPKLLATVVRNASRWRQRPRADYESYLGVSARVWTKSTQLSLRNTFGASRDLKLSPTAGPRWRKEVLSRRSHFFNCHGAPEDPHFYGQRGGDYPIAHDAAYLEGRIAEGTVATAECCYGAELYDPHRAGGQEGIVAVYLRDGAYGFFGSSNIAYGPAEGNGQADLICQYFLQRVLAGASVGRAALEARQRFVRETNVLDPADLKTLAQFSLIGDPSIQPVRSAAAAADGSPEATREARRANLLALGLALEDSRSYAVARPSARKASQPAIDRVREQFGLEDARVRSYDVEMPPALARLGNAALPAAPAAIHVLTAPLDGSLPARQYRVVVLAERSGELVSVRDLYTR